MWNLQKHNHSRKYMLILPIRKQMITNGSSSLRTVSPITSLNSKGNKWQFNAVHFLCQIFGSQ